MEDRQQYAESDPRHHTIKIRNMLAEVRDHLREDVRARGGVGLAAGFGEHRPTGSEITLLRQKLIALVLA